jgi:hypothetical protein
MRLDARRLALGLSGIRVSNGALLLFAPSAAATLYLGPGGREATARMLARFVGARDLLFGLAAITAVVKGERDAELMAMGAAWEGVDFVVSMLSKDASSRLKLAAPSAAIAAVLGAWTAKELAAARRV